jgi:hypothetical protein
MEQRRNDTAEEAARVYQATLGNVSPTDSVVLHHARIDDILIWTKEHLGAYLASAAVIIDQRDEPGSLQSILGCLTVCVVDRESYGFGRCSVLVITGVFKILLFSLVHWGEALDR